MKDLRFYRANKTNDGCALAFKLVAPKPDDKYDDGCVMLHYARQIGVDERDNAKIDWDNRETSIFMKLDHTDIGQILAVLYGYQDSINNGKGLYHKNARGATSLSFEAGKINILSDRDGNKLKGYIGVNPGDAALIRLFLKNFMFRCFNRKITNVAQSVGN